MMMAPVGPHVPVLIGAIIKRVSPVSGICLAGTFGAGGYARALLDAGADRVIRVDRDPEALERARPWAHEYGDRLTLRAGRFGDLDRIAAEAGAPRLNGIALDIGDAVPVLPGPAQRVDRRLAPVDRSIRRHQRLHQRWFHRVEERFERLPIAWCPTPHSHQPYDPPATRIRGSIYTSTHDQATQKQHANRLGAVDSSLDHHTTGNLAVFG